MGKIIITPPPGYDFVNVIVSGVNAPSSSIINNNADVAVNDQLVYKKESIRKEGGKGIVSVSPTGIPSIKGVKGQHVFDCFILDSNDNWKPSSIKSTIILGKDQLEISKPILIELERDVENLNFSIVNVDFMPEIEIFVDDVFYRNNYTNYFSLPYFQNNFNLKVRVGDGFGNFSLMSEPLEIIV